MPSLSDQIRKLLDTSLFLDTERKFRILNMLSGMILEEQKELFSLLSGEKDDISEVFSVFLTKKGSDGAEFLNAGFAKIQRNFLKSTEYSSRKKEKIIVQNLLSDLD